MFWFCCLLGIVVCAFLGAAVEAVFENNDMLRKMARDNEWRQWKERYERWKP